jgi:ATP-binding cassette subfamily B protein
MKLATKDSTNIRGIRWFWHFVRPDKFLFWYGTIGAVVSILVSDIIPPIIIAKAFDRIQLVLSQGQTLTFGQLSGYVYWYIVFLILSIVCWRTQAFATWLYSIRSQKRIYQALFEHIQSMGSKFHADRFGGALVSQVNKFAGAADRFIAEFTWNIVTSATALLFSVIVLFTMSWPYALVLTFIMSTYFALMYRRMKRQVPYNRRLAQSESEQTAKLADAITNVGTIRAFAGEEYERKLFARQAESTMQQHLVLMRIQMRNELFSQSSTNALNILAFGGGVLLLSVFHTPVGALYLTISYTIALTRRLWDSMFVMRNINRIFGDAGDMTDILALKPEIEDPAKPEQSHISEGAIVFNNVGFAHDGSKETLFENIDLHIKPGEKIGLVGPSGGGKTTITKLLLRFMDLDCGSIEIDGQNIAHITQADLRKAIAYVPQEPLLFHRSLAENIAYGKLNASETETLAAAKKAHAHEFISQLPNGYETLVGERGVKLSGGQRQRVAIARAMIKDAPILVLDEATSALDSESERLIQDALWKLMEGKTTLVIAHRLSTIQHMDRIVVLDKGEVVEQGSHAELLKNKHGLYAKLWAHQSGGFLEDE